MGGQTQLKFSCHWFWTVWSAILAKDTPSFNFIIIIHIILILIKLFSDQS